MELSVLNKLWKQQHPTGVIYIETRDGHLLDSGKQTGKFYVQFEAGGKPYRYSASSVYKLAERFNLIPTSNVNYFEESRLAIQAMLRGESFSSIAGLSDTINHLAEKEYHCYLKINIDNSKKDEYDRIIYTYTLIGKYESYQQCAELNGW